MHSTSHQVASENVAPYLVAVPIDETEREDRIIEQAQEIISQRLNSGQVVLNDPAEVKGYIKTLIGAREHEIFYVVFLDNRRRVIAGSEMFRGTIDGASVYPREVVKETLAHNAAAVIFAHNHPSGVAEPSAADRSITQRLLDALALIDVQVLDHLVIGETITSFAERGWL